MHMQRRGALAEGALGRVRDFDLLKFLGKGSFGAHRPTLPNHPPQHPPTPAPTHSPSTRHHTTHHLRCAHRPTAHHLTPRPTTTTTTTTTTTAALYYTTIRSPAATYSPGRRGVPER